VQRARVCEAVHGRTKRHSGTRRGAQPRFDRTEQGRVQMTPALGLIRGVRAFKHEQDEICQQIHALRKSSGRSGGVQRGSRIELLR
jgi:hypothetical protein